MPDGIQTRQATRISAQAAAGLVRSGDHLDWAFGLTQPDLFDRALADRREELENVTIRACFSLKPRAVLEADPAGDRFRWLNWHFSGYDRKHHDAGRSHYIPMNFGEVCDYYRRFIDPVDICVFKTCPADADGNFNLGASPTYARAIAERAKIVIVETSTAMPYVYGPENSLRASEVDYVIEGDNAALPQLPLPTYTEVDAAVARLIASEIEDGSCVQIGVGGMPNAVCSALKDSGVRDLGIHTEMMTDGIIDLYEAGIVTGARKTINPGKIVFTFAAGSQRQYGTLDRNDAFEAHPVDYTNDPCNIMRNDRAVSINNTTQIDLQGQCASESDGHRHISGTGGQLQFVRGAYASRGGKSFICLSSVYAKRGEPRSRIVMSLTPGNVVTTPRTDVMYVVTEYGMVNLKGKSLPERAKALIGIAHPDFREDLEREARRLGVIPRWMTATAG